MTSQLRDALDDLVTNVAPHVIAPNLAPNAWLAGRRRRLRRRLVNSALALAVAGAFAVTVIPLAGALRSLQPAGGDAGHGVTGYPQRIGHQWWTRDLPDRPGPIAALAKMVTEHQSYDEPDGWYAVSETGHRWRLPMRRNADDTYPTISPDGRRVGYLVHDGGPYVIHDLVTGKRTEFAEVGGGVNTVHTPYFISGQTPSFWSPDGMRLLLNGGLRSATDGGALVLDVDGSVVHVRSGAGMAAGWVGVDRLLWLTWPSEQRDLNAPGADVVAHVTRLDGEPIRTVTLRPSSPWQGTLMGQWTATASPDGTEVLVLDGRSSDAALGRRFSLADGTESADPVQVSRLAVPCGAGWAGSAPAIPVIDGTGNATTAVLKEGQVRPVAVVEPGLGSRCLVWAANALKGHARGGLPGMSTAWWTWWWRELFALALLASGVWMAVRWRRRRTR